MAIKPKLHYFNGRGRMETIRWLLAAAGVEFEEAEYLETRKQYEKLIQDGSLLFQQVPMVEIDGMKMVQTRAILNYIAGKHNLYGKDLKERALYCNRLIDMYVEGTMDLNEMVMLYPFSSPEEKEKNFALMIQRATNRYFPVYEKVLKDHGQDFLVGNQLSRPDVQILESILMIEEYEPTALSEFPLLQAFKARISNLPTIKKFLQPGSQRRTEPDDRIVETVNKVLHDFLFKKRLDWIRSHRGSQTLGSMAGKPKLYYFNGRGRMETIRWLLAAAGVEFEEQFCETREDLLKLQQDGYLLFQQVPMVEIDGMKMVQTRAILNYIAGKHNLYGKDLKERALIDMYVEATMDLNEIIMHHPLQPPEAKAKHLASIIEKATTRYFPVYEKALKDHGQDFLVGNRFSRADVQLLETILIAEECKPDILSKFPVLQAFKARISNIPTIKKFLQPGSQKKPPLDPKLLPKVMSIFNIGNE
ncbi:uncharacterized protein RBU57_003026 [Macrochelys suwanniensis]